jgi:hypothetical protein
MSRLNVHVFDHSPFMMEVCHLLEDILGRPVSEYEDWRKLINDAREVVKVMREPVATPNDAA